MNYKKILLLISISSTVVFFQNCSTKPASGNYTGGSTDPTGNFNQSGYIDDGGLITDDGEFDPDAETPTSAKVKWKRNCDYIGNSGANWDTTIEYIEDPIDGDSVKVVNHSTHPDSNPYEIDNVFNFEIKTLDDLLSDGNYPCEAKKVATFSVSGPNDIDIYMALCKVNSKLTLYHYGIWETGSRTENQEHCTKTI